MVCNLYQTKWRKTNLRKLKEDNIECYLPLKRFLKTMERQKKVDRGTSFSLLPFCKGQ
jgi:hypothetical protein